MNFLQHFFQLSELRLFGSVYGNLAELLEIFHKFQSSLTGTGTGGFVTFDYLSVCILCKLGEFGIDFFNKRFHVTISFILVVNDLPANFCAR